MAVDVESVECAVNVLTELSCDSDWASFLNGPQSYGNPYFSWPAGEKGP